jgi:thiamine-phosphate pyrophosphorylase
MDVLARFGFYGLLSDPLRGYEYLAKLFVDHEIRFIQLRMKTASRREFYKTSELLRKITDGTRSLFIVNDDVIVARDVSADGVHLGQQDTPWEEARKLFPRPGLIGLSTHNPLQAKEACPKGPAYIGVGPVYATPTKAIPDPVLGLMGMKEILGLATVPAVAIGGIDKSNLKEVIRNGAVNFCSVRAVNAAQNPEKELKELLRIYRGESEG